MASKNQIAILPFQEKAALVAGMTWQPVVSTNSDEREQGVYEFSQYYETNYVVVLATENCLQVGFLKNTDVTKEHQKIKRFYALAALVRSALAEADMLLVWKTSEAVSEVQFAVIVFDRGILVLDLLMSLADAQAIFENYEVNAANLQNFSIYSNDTGLFPTARQITDATIAAALNEESRLRRPRKPRLKAKETIPPKVLLKWAGIALAVVLGSYFVYQNFFAVKKPESVKPKDNKPRMGYERKLLAELPKLGMSQETFASLIDQMQSQVVMIDGWRLKTLQCDHKGCVSEWQGGSGWPKTKILATGEQVSYTQEKKFALIKLKRSHDFPLVGVLLKERLTFKEKYASFCAQEEKIFSQLSIELKCRKAGKMWPADREKVPPEKMVFENELVVQGGFSDAMFAIQRFKEGVYWKSATLKMEADDKKIRRLLTFELNGSVYAQN